MLETGSGQLLGFIPDFNKEKRKRIQDFLFTTLFYFSNLIPFTQKDFGIFLY